MRNETVKSWTVCYVVRDVSDDKSANAINRQLICWVCQRQLLIREISVEVRFEAHSGGYEEFCLLTHNAM
jgi:hypothetical protein